MRVDLYGERVALRAHEWSEQSYPLPVYASVAPYASAPYLHISLGPTHDLARSPAFGSSGGSFYIPGSLSPSLQILGIIPKK